MSSIFHVNGCHI